MRCRATSSKPPMGWASRLGGGGGGAGRARGREGRPHPLSEAAGGGGFPAGQRRLRVDLPLAMPLIVAGLRIATVTTIGLVMAPAPIGAGGVGTLVMAGFPFPHYT